MRGGRKETKLTLSRRACPFRTFSHAHPLPPHRAGGIFKLELFLPEDYPMAAPKVRREKRREKAHACLSTPPLVIHPSIHPQNTSHLSSLSFLLPFSRSAS